MYSLNSYQFSSFRAGSIFPHFPIWFRSGGHLALILKGDHTRTMQDKFGSIFTSGFRILFKISLI